MIEVSSAGMGVWGKGPALEAPLPHSLRVGMSCQASALAGVEGCCSLQHNPRAGDVPIIARKGISSKVEQRGKQ